VGRWGGEVRASGMNWKERKVCRHERKREKEPNEKRKVSIKRGKLKAKLRQAYIARNKHTHKIKDVPGVAAAAR